MEPTDLAFENIQVGGRAAFTRSFTQEDLQTFVRVSGDANPLHTNRAYAQNTRFKKPIVHGMLVGALCSTLVGMHLPGRRCLYLRQTLSFKQPVYVGDVLRVEGVVTEKVESTHMLSIAISIRHEDTLVLEGVATVQVLS